VALIRCAECKAKVSDKAISCPKCGAPVEISRKKGKSEIKTGPGCLILLLVAVGIFIAFRAKEEGHREKASSSPPRKPTQSRRKKAPVVTPSYTIVDQDKYDAPIKTEITLHAIVSGKITEAGLKALLHKLYEEACAMRAFRHHGGRPTHVFIYLYTSREHFDSRMGQWIAMLSRVGADAPVKTEIRTELIPQLSALPEVKYGLTESKRKEIFRAIVRAEDQADAEAERRYPLDPTRHLRIGETFTLSERTPLMPEVQPTDPLAALQRVKYLPPGTRITIVSEAARNNTPWYEVRASSPSGRPLGRGWINSLALRGQSGFDPRANITKRAALVLDLDKKYKAEIAKRYGITEEQLRAISLEGIKKNWPIPPMHSDN